MVKYDIKKVTEVLDDLSKYQVPLVTIDRMSTTIMIARGMIDQVFTRSDREMLIRSVMMAVMCGDSKITKTVAGRILTQLADITKDANAIAMSILQTTATYKDLLDNNEVKIIIKNIAQVQLFLHEQEEVIPTELADAIGNPLEEMKIFVKEQKDLGLCREVYEKLICETEVKILNSLRTKLGVVDSNELVTFGHTILQTLCDDGDTNKRFAPGENRLSGRMYKLGQMFSFKPFISKK